MKNQKKIFVRDIFEDKDLLTPKWALNEEYIDINENKDASDNIDEDEIVDDMLDEADEELKELYKIFEDDSDSEEDSSAVETLEDNKVEENSLFEDDDVTPAQEVEDRMTDEELKDESLKIAINVAKLMTNVQANDIITIAGTIADFIRNHEIGESDLENLSANSEQADTAADIEEDNYADSDAENENTEDYTGDNEINDEDLFNFNEE